MTLVTDRDRGRGSQSRQKERGAQAGGPGATGEVSGLALSTRCKDARPLALSVHVRGHGGEWIFVRAEEEIYFKIYFYFKD